MRNRRRKYDLTGQRIGALTALEPCSTKYDGAVGWRCVCDCGAECVKTTQQLIDVVKGKRNTISCGCNRNRNVEDLTGQIFGRLHVIKRATEYGLTKWECTCECGNVCTVLNSDLLTGHTQSCGCLEKENRKNLWKRKCDGKILSYGDRSKRYNERLYNVWNGMKSRCYNPNVASYKNYGGRGIEVCDEWVHNFPAFQKWAIENGYDSDAPFGECTIDRIDVNGNYEPSNCRWVSMDVQRYNKR